MQKFHARQALLPNGWRDHVTIDVDSEGHIAAIQTGAQEAADGHDILLPGCPNLHSHSFQRAMAGLGETRAGSDDDFWSWRQAMYQLAGTLSPDDVEVIATHLFIEMLKAGYTRVVEFHYLHRSAGDETVPGLAMSEALIRAARTAGIGLTLIPVLYQRQGFSNNAPLDSQRRYVLSGEQYIQLLEALLKQASVEPFATIGLGFHSLRAVSPDAMTDLLNASSALGLSGPVHIHIAEQQREVNECLEVNRARPVEWLFNHADVDESWCLVHATHLSDHENELIARTSAVAGLCPTTEANLGDGIFELGRYEALKGRYGIGSDSHITVDPFDELRLLEYSNRLAERRRLIAGHASGQSCALTLFQSAIGGGLQAAGLKSRGLEVGAPADFVCLTTDHPLLAGKSNDAVLDGLIFGQAKGVIRDVIVGGKTYVSKGSHAAAERAQADYLNTIQKNLHGI